MGAKTETGHLATWRQHLRRLFAPAEVKDIPDSPSPAGDAHPLEPSRDVAPRAAVKESPAKQFPVLEFPAGKVPGKGGAWPAGDVEVVKVSDKRTGLVWELALALRDAGGDPLCRVRDEDGEEWPHYAPNLTPAFAGVDEHAQQRMEALQAQARQMLDWDTGPPDRPVVLAKRPAWLGGDMNAPDTAEPPVKYAPHLPRTPMPAPGLSMPDDASPGRGRQDAGR